MTRFGYPIDMDKIGIEQMEQLKSWDHAVGPPQKWSIYDFERHGRSRPDYGSSWIYPRPDKQLSMSMSGTSRISIPR